MAKVIIITGYIDGNEVSRLWNHTDEREELIKTVTEIVEEQGTCGDLIDTINAIRVDGYINATTEVSFLELMPKVDSDGIDELTDIKIVNWDVVNTYELPS